MDMTHPRFAVRKVASAAVEFGRSVVFGTATAGAPRIDDLIRERGAGHVSPLHVRLSSSSRDGSDLDDRIANLSR